MANKISLSRLETFLFDARGKPHKTPGKMLCFSGKIPSF